MMLPFSSPLHTSQPSHEAGSDEQETVVLQESGEQGQYQSSELKAA